MEKHDIIIVGAGNAGLKAAEILAENKKDVLVLERRKKIDYKTCAGGITTKALELGIPTKILQRKFRSVKIHSPNQILTITQKRPFIFTIDMKDMNQHMAKCAKDKGAIIRTNSNVTKIKKNSVIVNNKKEIKFNYLIGADGSTSTVRRSLGLNSKKLLQAIQYVVPKKFKDLELFFDVDKFPAYLWIFPYKDTTSIGTGGDLNYKDYNLRKIKKNLDNWCKKRFDIKKARFESSLINYDYQGFQFKNKFLIGDAGGMSSGLTGEGMYFGMIAGIDVANKIINKNYECKNIKHILKVKKIEEKILKSLEINKALSKIEVELLLLLLRSKWIDKKFIENVD